MCWYRALPAPARPLEVALLRGVTQAAEPGADAARAEHGQEVADAGGTPHATTWMPAPSRTWPRRPARTSTAALSLLPSTRTTLCALAAAARSMLTRQRPSCQRRRLSGRTAIPTIGVCPARNPGSNRLLTSPHGGAPRPSRARCWPVVSPIGLGYPVRPRRTAQRRWLRLAWSSFSCCLPVPRARPPASSCLPASRWWCPRDLSRHWQRGRRRC